LPPPAAIRRHYVERLTTRRGWSHLLRRGIDLRKAARGLRAAGSSSDSRLAVAVGSALAASPAPVTFLLAAGDATGVAFEVEYARGAFAALRASGRAKIEKLDSGSHSFAGQAERDWLAQRVVEVLEGIKAA
jgi:hypothetical protein